MAGRVTLARILTATAAAHRVSVGALQSGERKTAISHPRQRAVYVARRLRPDMSYPFLGQRLGGRDHTTMLHADRAVERRLADPAYRDDEYAGIQAILCELELSELRAAELPAAARQIIDGRIRRCEQIISALRNRQALFEGAPA